MMNVQNFMEYIVAIYLEEVIDTVDTCKCDICKQDIMAIALNNLKPMYGVTEKGKIIMKAKVMEHQAKADIISEILKAIDIVRNNRRHE